MKLSYNWLQDYFEKKLPEAEEIKEKLSLHAFEVEGVEKRNEDYILDIDILPNRAHDALSYIGIAREVAMLFGLDLKLPEFKYEEVREKSSDHISLKVKSDFVRRAMKRVVLDVKIKKSPDWLKERLASMGQKSINNIVDITNFVMWETGQPVHAFDLDKILEGKIDIRGAEEGEKITTLDGGEYTLRKGMLVISDPEKPLDIAGIKGGDFSGIDENTKKVVLSVCSFDSVWIRKTSRALDLSTDASYRFERDISPVQTKIAMERLSSLVSKFAGGRVSKEILDVYLGPQEEDCEIGTSLQRVNEVLGTSIKKNELEEILDKLKIYSNFDWQEKGGRYVVQVPQERVDLLPAKEELVSGNEEDLIEEIGRIYGFYKIESKLPEEKIEVKVNKEVSQIESLKDFLISEGFSEVMTYSFVEKGKIKLANPLSSEKKYLRESLEGGLRKSLELNVKNAPLLGLRDVKIFEIGKVFSKKSEDLYLGIAISLKNKKEQKEYLKKILSAVELRGETVGDSILLVKLDGKGKDSYENLNFNIDTKTKFKKISPYPFVLRDIAVWVPQQVESLKVLKVIKENGGKLLVNLKLFDEYKKDGKVSYAFNLVFQSNEKTLSDSEVGEKMHKVESSLVKEGWEVR